MGPGATSSRYPNREIDMSGFEELDADDAKKAKRRMKNMCATPEEVERYMCAPNAARHNDHPAIPLEDYGELLDN